MCFMHNCYKSRPKRYVGCFLSRMFNWMWIVYNELRSILLIGKIERVRWEATNGKELQMTDQVKSLDHFLNEGEKYLCMAHDLHEFNEKSSELLPRVLKALDAYTRLNAFCKSTNLWNIARSYQYEYFCEKPTASKCRNNEKIVEGKDGHDGKIMKGKEKRDEEIKQDECNEKTVKNENKYVNEMKMKKYDEMMKCQDVIFIFQERNEKESDQYDDYADSLLAKDYCVIIFLRQLMNINALVAQLQDLYAAFNKRRLLLYILLTDYCLKADSFLCMNAQFRGSRKLRRGKKHNMRPKYKRLEQLVARIIEERKYMAKYIETADNYRRPEASAK